MNQRADEKVEPTILGVGCAVPDAVRANDDPIFAYLNELKDYIEKTRSGEGALTAEAEEAFMKSWGLISGTNRGPFYGYETRRVLKQDERLIDIMKPAAEEALETASVAAKDVDLVLGCASVSQYIVPNELYELHRDLGLPEHSLVVPFGNDFSNFSIALVHADALIRARRADTILVVVGGGWSRAVDYRTIQAYSAGDGAGAVVVGKSRDGLEKWQTWSVVDQEVLADSGKFGTMYLSEVMHASNSNYLHRYVPGPSPSWRWPGMPVSELQTAPCFSITPSGFGAFYQFGRDEASKPAEHLVDKNGILGKDVTLIAHQASEALSNTWKEKIGPADFFNTTKHYANMTVANLPVNLALALSPLKAQERAEMSLKEVSTPYLLLLALGPDMHAHALLLGNKSLMA